MRYYFHVRDGDRLLEDPDGSDLPNLDAAREEALAGARHLLSEKLQRGEVIDGQRFEITDESGEVLEIVPFKAVLRLP